MHLKCASAVTRIRASGKAWGTVPGIGAYCRLAEEGFFKIEG
jgi:hypothetical protein